jgi:glutamate-1-semialdehyde 2,1-aminomutase
MSTTTGVVNRAALQQAVADEVKLHEKRTPKSGAAFGAAEHLLGRVPMTWQAKMGSGRPIYLASASGCRITDIDGNSYVDFALGDTGAMTGHSPQPTLAAVRQRLFELGGVTCMMPTVDAEAVGAELTRRFKVPIWSFTLTATDANRWALRIARLVTGRPKICAFAYSYHGSVDETLGVLDARGNTVNRPGNVAPAIDVVHTTRIAEFNSVESVEAALKHRDVAVLIMEPAMTNIGIVLPKAGFLDAVKALCVKYGTLLLIDETHTISMGPGGCTQAWNLQPDIFVIGKCVGGGIPCGAYGLSRAVADKIGEHQDADLQDVGGVGGTLAGNALSTAAMRATLTHVLTDAAFKRMLALGTRLREGIERGIREFNVPWTVVQLGARAEYRFAPTAPTNGTESAAAHDGDLDTFMHLYVSNRGLLITPFHNMLLACPDTTPADVDLHTKLFRDAVADLVRRGVFGAASKPKGKL